MNRKRIYLIAALIIFPLVAKAQTEEADPQEEGTVVEVPPLQPPSPTLPPPPTPPLIAEPSRPKPSAVAPEAAPSAKHRDEYTGLKEMINEIGNATNAAAAGDREALNNLVGRSWVVTYEGYIQKNYQHQWIVTPSPPLAWEENPVTRNGKYSITVTLKSLDGLMLAAGFMKKIDAKVMAGFSHEEGGDLGEGAGEHLVLVRFRTSTLIIDPNVTGPGGKLLFLHANCKDRDSYIYWEPAAALEPRPDVHSPGAFIFKLRTDLINTDIRLTLCFISLEDNKFRVAHTTIPGLEEKPTTWLLDLSGGYPLNATLALYYINHGSVVSGFGSYASYTYTQGYDHTLAMGVSLLGPEIRQKYFDLTVISLGPNVFTGSRYSGVGLSVSSMIHFCPTGSLRPLVAASYEYGHFLAREDERTSDSNVLMIRLGLGIEL